MAQFSGRTQKDQSMPQEQLIDAADFPLEVIADYACEIGENPLWHPIERRLYWCDIPNGRLFRYDPATGAHERCFEGRPIGGFTIQADGALLLFLDRGAIALWREGGITEVVSEIAAEQHSRFNDVIADPRGRVFCGTMSSNESKGTLYRLDPDGSLHPILGGIGCSNGMAFTLDRNGLYYTDSFAREIYLFDYSVEDGSLTNQRVFARFSEDDGFPDGAALDSAGCLWSAIWNGSCLVRLSADGRIDRKIAIPARKTSSLTFGGEGYSDIYITTAGGNTKEEDGRLAGALFRIRAQPPGLPEFFSRIQDPALR
jgi:D-xylonolactonase